MRKEKNRILNKEIFFKDAKSVAQKLLGKVIIRKFGDKKIRIMITETEAYLGENDMASHARFGKTGRNSVMFEKGGVWYVYFIYGMYWLLNIVTGTKNNPSAVLIRRGILLGKNTQVIKGPALVARYLKVDGKFSGRPNDKKTGLWIEDWKINVRSSDIKKLSRVGVDYAGKWARRKLRFVISDPLPKKSTGA